MLGQQTNHIKGQKYYFIWHFCIGWNFNVRGKIIKHLKREYQPYSYLESKNIFKWNIRHANHKKKIDIFEHTKMLIYQEQCEKTSHTLGKDFAAQLIKE